MKTTNKLEIMLDVIEKADKNALINLVNDMSQSEIRHMAKIVPAIRSSLKYEYADRPIPVYRVKAEAVAEPIVEVNEGVGVFSFKHQVPPSMRVPRRRVLYK